MAKEPIDIVRRNKLQSIGLFHLGAGCGISGITEIGTCFEVVAGIGSYRNLFNSDIGIGYEFTTAPFSKQQRVISNRIPISVTGSVNFLHHDNKCAFAGLGFAYYFRDKSRYYDSGVEFDDINLCNNFSLVSVALGYRIKMLNISLRCTYSLAPKYNQKYIYETEAYDFDATGAQIYNRFQAGIKFLYYFQFGL